MPPTLSLDTTSAQVSAEGQPMYTYKPLETDVSKLPIFVAGLRLKHRIDPKSPIFGLKSQLDGPGEYHIDRRTAKLSFIPPEGAGGGSYSVSRLDSVIVAKGVR